VNGRSIHPLAPSKRDEGGLSAFNLCGELEFEVRAAERCTIDFARPARQVAPRTM
jgi:hypothetical protein